MDFEELKKIKDDLEKKDILTPKEISRLYFFLFEIMDTCEKIEERIDKDLKNALKKDDPLILANELIDFEIELGVAIDYFRDAKKIFTKISDRLYEKYSQE